MTCSLLSCVAALVMLHSSADWRVQEKEDIKQTLQFSDPAKARRLIVDNLNGAITVAGHGGNEVQLVAIKTLRARSPEKLAEAKEMVRLEISERDNVIELYVDGPFRRCDRDRNYRGSDYYGFEVQFDFTLKVPWQTDLELKTVNDGDIEVSNVAGEFDVNNINGSVKMLEVAGGGRAYALNGELAVRFKKNPELDSYFGSLNGEVKVEFLENLSADVRLKTFNGEVYTDFHVTSLPARAAVQEKSRGRFVYRSDSASGVRIGSGGPELEFDAFNGDIHIVKRLN
jgi:hypothetical protein